MEKEKWQNINREEQECVIILDYGQKELNLYTSREAVYKRLIKKIGNPIKIYYNKNLISGASWKLKFANEKTVKIFSKTLLIGDLK